MRNNRIFTAIVLVIHILKATSSTEISERTDLVSQAPIDVDQNVRLHGEKLNTQPVRRLRQNKPRDANKSSSGKPRSHATPGNKEQRRRRTQERNHGGKATLAPTAASVSMSIAGYGTPSPTPAPAVFEPDTPAPVSEETGESSGGGGGTSHGGPIGVSVNVSGNSNVVTTNVEINQGYSSVTHAEDGTGGTDDSNDDEPSDDTFIDDAPVDDVIFDDAWDNYDDEFQGSVCMSYGDTDASSDDQPANFVDDNNYESLSMSYGDTEGSSDDYYANFVDDDDIVGNSMSTSLSMSQSSYYDDGVVDDYGPGYFPSDSTTPYEPKK